MYSPEVVSLIKTLISSHDKRIAKGTAGAARPTKLDEKVWPEYHACQFVSVRTGWVQELEHMEALGLLVTYVALDAPMKVSLKCLDGLRAVAGVSAPEVPYRKQWLSAVADVFAQLGEERCAAISRLELSVPGKSAKEVATALAALPGAIGLGLSLREASARLFWADSKVLDTRQQLISTVLGKDECPFPSSPVGLNVKLCRDPQGILFIENLDTFEKLSKRPHAFHLVYASGFRASAKRVRNREGSTVYFREGSDYSQADSFLGWLYKDTPAMAVHLWGDLDWAGMAILKASKEAFPGMTAWAPGYELMMETAENGLAHTLDMAGKSGQQEVERTGCSYADKVVLPFLRAKKLFVDQEAVDATAVAAVI